jgi:hypothetical protein
MTTDRLKSQTTADWRLTATDAGTVSAPATAGSSSSAANEKVSWTGGFGVIA